MIDRRLLLGGVSAFIVAPALAGSRAGPEGDGDGYVTLEARPGALRLAPAPATETAVWCYGGKVPGPLLRIRKGAELKVRLVNRLDQPTTLSWHGLRGPNAMDGVAGLTQKPVLPGESFDYRFTPPDAGLFWYHPHVMPFSAGQVGRGLYGVLIVDEAEPVPADREIICALSDWSLDAKGAIRPDVSDRTIDDHDQAGTLLTADSRPVPWEILDAPGTRIRLRLLNAATARIMIVSFEGVLPKVQAIDGQPCPLFEPVRATLPIGPGARFDVIIDLPPESGKTASLILRGAAGRDETLLSFKTKGAALKPRPPVASLPDNPALPTRIPLEKALKMDLVIEGGPKLDPHPGKSERDAPAAKAEAPAKTKAPVTTPPAPRWTINGSGAAGFSGRPLFTVRRGSAVSLGLVNKTSVAQEIHLHGHVMRLLHDLDDGWEPYWRDAVLVAAGRTKHIAFVADNPGKWALESAIIERQDDGLAAWFEVT